MSTSQVKNREQDLALAVETHRGRLLKAIGSLVRDRVEAEDVLQDVFAEFVETYDLGQAIETLGAWLMRVAQNKVRDRFRRNKTQSDYQALSQSTAEQDGMIDSGNEWMRERFRTEILNALETLPPEQREVFVQHELEGKSFEEIAAESGVNINTLLSRKRSAVSALREELKEIYDELE